MKISSRRESSRGKTSSQVESTHIRILSKLPVVRDVNILLDVRNDFVQLLLDALLLNLLAARLKISMDNEMRNKSQLVASRRRRRIHRSRATID